MVATVLTACGIETDIEREVIAPDFPVATVLTACGIETCHESHLLPSSYFRPVATVLTACGIETLHHEDTDLRYP